VVYFCRYRIDHRRWKKVSSVPVELIIFLFFILVLAPVVAVLAYCGIRGTCGQNEEETKGSQKQ